MAMNRLILITITVFLTAALATSWAAEPKIGEINPPETTASEAPLSVDNLVGSYTFGQAQPNTFINGYIEFFPDHTWTMVVHFDDDRDRITDRYQVFKGEYAVRKTSGEPVFMIYGRTDEGEQIKETKMIKKKISTFTLGDFAFTRRKGEAPYFDHSLNVPKTAHSLKVTTDPPGAIVYLDGVRVKGNTPLVIQKPPAGRPVALRIEMVGHSPKRDTVTLNEFEKKALTYSLVTGQSELWIATKPWTRVILDGKYVGNAPVKLKDLPAGQHKVRLENAGAEIDDTFEVELKEGEVAKEVRKYTGTLDIYVGKEADIVNRDGKVIGKAPTKGLEMTVGNHNLRLVDLQTKTMKILLVRIRLDKATVVNENWDDLQTWKE